MESTALADRGSARTVLPSDLQQVRTVIKYDILKHLRSRRLLGMLVIEALVLALIAALALGQPAQPFTSTMGGFAGLASTLIIIAATLFAGDAIVSEFQGRTGYLLFPNPVKRSSLFLGKFLSVALAMVLVVLIYYAVAIGLSAAISSDVQHLDLAFMSLGLALLYSLAAAGLGLLISSFMKGGTGAIILTFFMLFMILPSVDSIFQLTEDLAPTPSLTYASMAISSVMSVPYPPETVLMDLGVGGFKFYLHTPPLLTAVAVMAAWTVATLALAFLLFRRREMAA